MVRLESTKTAESKEFIQKKLEEIHPKQHFHTLALDAFRIISEWYHYAILELMELEGFRQDPQWIAKKLDISINESKIAIQRLKRAGILSENKNGKWINHCHKFTSTLSNDFTNRALKKLQEQILTKALKALEEVPIERRDQTGMLMPINTKRLPEIKKMIKEFRRRLCSYVNEDKTKDAVYQLGISFYPLTVSKSGGNKQ